MSLRRTLLVLTLAAVAAALATPISQADEGMWLFNSPPKKMLKERYGFDATDAWLTHLQHASLRINQGGSGSFVSPKGLVMTNHHVGGGALEKLSTKDRDLLKTGFYARSSDEELKCPDSEFVVLESIEDVTARVNAAVKSAANSAEADKLRRAEIINIRQESFKKTGLRSDVITLFRGGLYQLYRYKRYTDVRLVFAPQQQAAYFGGDPDNFEYPRYDLDICFFRVYEDGKPVSAPYLKWNPASLAAGDLVFVSGNPARTDRLNTVHHLEFIRDCLLPMTLNMLRRREVTLMAFCQRSAEHSREGKELLMYVQNSRKARLGGLAGLQDPAIMRLKQAEEAAFRQAAEASSHAAVCKTAFATIDKSLASMASIREDHAMLEQGQAFQSTLFIIARALVRLAEETAKPNADRLEEYCDANLPSLKQTLFSPAPIYPRVQTALLADSLSAYLEEAGQCGGISDRQLAEKVMADKSPDQRAAELVQGTKLADVAVRRKLAEGGLQAIEASDDPMIQLARMVDKPARKVRTIYEQQVEEPQRWAYGKLADARFALFGADTYPDATFTLRLSVGTIKGYEQAGVQVPVWTTLAGLYRTAKEHDYAEPFNLPQIWLDRKDRLDLNTPYNFICTDNIIGGNSGSPVVNRQGELVGIIFDGNIQSLVWDYVYTETQGRSLAVHGSAILEALRKVYDAGALADELMGK